VKILVTGGGGFLGKAIVKRLIERGDEVRTLARSNYPELDQLGATQYRGDLADATSVQAAAEGCDLVIHTAAKAGVWGSYDSYYQTNVIGSENVVIACRNAGIQRLVYTSTPSVTFAGTDQEGTNESAPFPKKFLAHYPATKAIAETYVLGANDDALATVALRPHLIWGPGDNHLVPRLLDRAKSGKLKLVDGSRKLVDASYIDNVVDAHILAADKLEPGHAMAGNAYFISNDEPMAMVDIINGILKAGDLPPVARSVSSNLAFLAGSVLETVYGILGKKDEPLMTRFVARQLATAHWFDISAAKRDLGYQPQVSMEEGFKRLGEWLKTNPYA
jgi:nucleoside-diphosphate-sugar epimerase